MRTDDLRASELYHRVDEVLAPAIETPGGAYPLQTLSTTDEPMLFREELAAELKRAHVPDARALDMLMAANEVFGNAIRHAGGLSALRAGTADGWFLCEIDDEGPGLSDPLAGWLPPSSADGRGKGLWLARQLLARLDFIPAPTGQIARLWI